MGGKGICQLGYTLSNPDVPQPEELYGSILHPRKLDKGE